MNDLISCCNIGILLIHNFLIKKTTELGSFQHAVEGDMLCLSTNTKIPYFNAPIYLQNKSQIGKIDEILGPISQVFFTVKLQEGVVATSFKEGDKVYIAPDKLLPMDRFLPKPKTAGAKGIHTFYSYLSYRDSKLTFFSLNFNSRKGNWTSRHGCQTRWSRRRPWWI